ncbi:MAG: class I SAM-dependent methyltransferase [Chryseotalea sp.]
MVNALIKILKPFPWFKRFNAKITYELLAKHIPAQDWQFMNYGYVPTADEPALHTNYNFTKQVYPLQMYHYLALHADLNNKQVLEVGSGRGGGARYLAENFQPKQYIGLDLAQSAVDLANKIHQLPNLKYIQGSAEKLPFPPASQDVVINVESCHSYGRVDIFLSEVERVLKPGGYLLLVDFRSEYKMDDFRKLLKETKLTLLKEEDISQRVIQSIEAENPDKVKRIEELIPKRWQKLFSDFAGVVGSRFYNTLKDGSRSYYRFVLHKPS